jgi:hypothetical protein
VEKWLPALEIERHVLHHVSHAHEAISLLSTSVAYWWFLRGIGDEFVQQSEIDVKRYKPELSLTTDHVLPEAGFAEHGDTFQVRG